jgi:predicted Rossmann fold flavoprotein
MKDKIKNQTKDSVQNGNENHYDVIVIGGGASGLMTAGRAGELGKKVLILEGNKRLGEKLRITGGGRCNVTNAEPDVRKFLSVYGKAEPFLHSIFSQFSNLDTFKFFEGKGLPLVVQARQRAFPHTEKALDVYNVMEKYVTNDNVKIVTNSKVTKINCSAGKIVNVECGKNIYTANEYVLATGSLSHPETGSTGDGFKWLNDLGHTVAAPTPSIVPLAVPETWVHTLAGVSLSFMKITFFVENSNGVQKKSFVKTGKVLFTHFGLSGPLILNSAKQVSSLLHTGIVTAKIDAYPDTDLGALDRKIVAIFDNNKNKLFKNIVAEFVPEGTQKGILLLLAEKIDIDKKVHSISRDERKYIVNTLKALPITISGLMGFDRAVIADGGVPLGEVDMRTMRSSKVKNLFITGDLLHINRPSGGFSLQLCWTTGYVAGSNAGK